MAKTEKKKTDHRRPDVCHVLHVRGESVHVAGKLLLPPFQLLFQTVPVPLDFSPSDVEVGIDFSAPGKGDANGYQDKIIDVVIVFEQKIQPSFDVPHVPQQIVQIFRVHLVQKPGSVSVG